MLKLFKKKQILTIPNLLSLVRLILIPCIVWLYSFEKNYYAAIGMIILSGVTDIVDGWIARHFNMVSDFGKFLDPLADKLTQAALLICLLSEYSLMWALIVIFGVCEITKLILGFIIAKKYDEVTIDEVIEKNLQVVDMTASILARDNKMPMWVFGLNEENSIVNTIKGNFTGTKVTV